MKRKYHDRHDNSKQQKEYKTRKYKDNPGLKKNIREKKGEERKKFLIKLKYIIHKQNKNLNTRTSFILRWLVLVFYIRHLIIWSYIEDISILKGLSSTQMSRFSEIEPVEDENIETVLEKIIEMNTIYFSLRSLKYALKWFKWNSSNFRNAYFNW